MRERQRADRAHMCAAALDQREMGRQRALCRTSKFNFSDSVCMSIMLLMLMGFGDSRFAGSSRDFRPRAQTWRVCVVVHYLGQKSGESWNSLGISGDARAFHVNSFQLRQPHMLEHKAQMRPKLWNAPAHIFIICPRHCSRTAFWLNHTVNAIFVSCRPNHSHSFIQCACIYIYRSR